MVSASPALADPKVGTCPDNSESANKWELVTAQSLVDAGVCSFQQQWVPSTTTIMGSRVSSSRPARASLLESRPFGTTQSDLIRPNVQIR